jgi:chromosome partitioning protein
MTTLAIGSQKGGVGKTTVALNLCLSLARRGWRTVLVDTDPQGAVGLSLEGAKGDGSGLLACLEGRSTLAQAVLATKLPELAILPLGRTSPDDPAEAAARLSDPEALGGVLAEASRDYELVVLDTASGMHGVSLAALSLADHLLVPLQAEPLALRSITRVLEAVARLREAGSRVALAGFLLTMLNSRSDVSLSVAQESWGTLPTDLILDTVVPRDTVFLKASAYGVPVAFLSRRPPPVAMVFDQVAAELEGRMGLLKEGEEDEPVSLLA